MTKPIYKNNAMHRLLPIVLLLTLASCNPDVQFSEPMPPARFNLPNIPGAYRGVIEVDDERWEVGKDTIRHGDEVFVNGEDFLLRRMAGHLMFNQPIPSTGLWEVRVIRKEGAQRFVGAFDGNEAFLTRAQTLMEGRVVPRRSEGSPGYRYHEISPTAKEFRVMLKEGWYTTEDEPLRILGN